MRIAVLIIYNFNLWGHFKEGMSFFQILKNDLDFLGH